LGAEPSKDRRVLISGGAILTMDPALRDIGRGDVLVGDGRILEVGSRIDAPDAERIDASGCIVMPGFVDTHRHTWQSALRHRCGDVDFHGYGKSMLRTFGPVYSPEDIYVGNLLGAVSALDAGTTTLLDWSHALNTPSHADAAIAALRDSGLRAVFAYGWSRTEGPVWTVESTRRHPQDIVRVRRDVLASDDALVTLAMAGRGPEMTTMDVVREDFALARELGIRVSMHVGANDFGARFRAVERMHEARLLGPDLTLIHLCDSSDHEFELMAQFGVSASIGAQCEMTMEGVGLPVIGRLMAAGIRPSLSGDTETCGSGDMFTQMRFALASHRMLARAEAASARGSRLTAREVLEFATLVGAEANGLGHRIGSITVGKEADIILVRHDDLNLMPLNDPVGAIVLAAHPGNVDTVMVRGKILKRAGKMLGIDIGILHERACASRDRLLEAAGAAPA
jgi:5-methylthioadenosine/S-adenosylhomocysteine deaminase